MVHQPGVVENAPITVEFSPGGQTICVPSGTTLLEAARMAKIEITAVCTGASACGTCRVRRVSGDLLEPTEDERYVLAPGEIARGHRLACQAVPTSDVRIEVLSDSLSTRQRLQLEGLEIVTEIDTGLRIIEGPGERIVMRGEVVLAYLPSGNRFYGLAVDLGTTKLAAYLVDLESGRTVAKAGQINPHVTHGYGEDVVSRIASANQNPSNLSEMQRLLFEAVGNLLDRLCLEAGVIRAVQVLDAVMVGNTVMQQILMGLPLKSLGEAPYHPAQLEGVDIASRIELGLVPGACIYVPPVISGYCGGDHVAALLATGLGSSQSRPVMLLDIGTNTEVSLAMDGRLLSCSCASGPAFEGARISQGMRAEPGAIERVRWVDGEMHCATVGNQLPVGLCGSGILDAVAAMLDCGAITTSGALQANHPRVHRVEKRASFTLVPRNGLPDDREIRVIQKDVREIQLAKGAIRTGVEILLSEAGLVAEDLERVYLAGAFGTYLDVRSAVRVGMLPDLPIDRYDQVGNAAGAGARRMLLSREYRCAAEEVARRAEYIELAVHPDFEETFVRSMSF
jgi:uncharacterized 2Fe-2S/4Fe-4S cluster protein (DUF4445 family)